MSKRIIFLDPDPNPALTQHIDGVDCPNEDQHTPAPRGYLEHHEWMAQQMRDGKRARRCQGCSRYAIWS